MNTKTLRNGTKWVINSRNNRYNYKITNANKKNGNHSLIKTLTPQSAFLNYTHGWFVNMRKPHRPASVQRRMNILKNYMKKHPIHVNTNIYRGIPKQYSSSNYNNVNNRTNYTKILLNKGYLNSNSFISFSKNRRIANGFAHGGITVVLGPGKYPAVENGRNGFITNQGEREVLLAPGRLTLRKNRRPNGNYVVNYTHKS